MDAYARDRTTPDAAENCERIMWELLDLTDEKQQEGQQHHLLVSRPTGPAAVGDGSIDDGIEDWRMTSVDTVLNAWSRQGTWEAATRAEQILERLESYADEEYRLSSSSGGRSSSPAKTSSIKPTAHSYATVIHGWALCAGQQAGEKNTADRRAAAAEKAQSILNRMLERAENKVNQPKPKNKNADIVVTPDTVIFNSIINAWANSGDPAAGSKALALLNLMQELHANSKHYDTRPDVVSYNTVLSAFSHSRGDANAAYHAERVLNEMMMAHRQAPGVSPAPNVVSYNNVLHSWSRHQGNDGGIAAAERAEAVLYYMLRAGQKEISPDIYSFTSVLNAVAKSKNPNKASKAQDWLNRLCDFELKQQLTQVPFNAVLNACAFSAMGTTQQQQRQALQIAVQTFQSMKNEYNLQPDTVSYGNMIKCASNLIPKANSKARNEMALQLFDKCCEDGMVGDLVWNQMLRTVDPTNILQDRIRPSIPSMQKKKNAKPISALRLQDLPKEWRRNNVRDKRRAPSGHSGGRKTLQQQRRREQQQQQRRSGPVQRLRNISEPSYQSGRDM